MTSGMLVFFYENLGVLVNDSLTQEISIRRRVETR